MWQEWKREDEWGQIESERTLPADFKRAEVVEAFAFTVWGFAVSTAPAYTAIAISSKKRRIMFTGGKLDA